MSISPLHPDFQIVNPQTGKISEEFLRWVDEMRAGISSFPSGVILSTLADAEPSGWLFCNGQSVSKAQFEGLYQVVGDTFGSTGTNFNLPDLTDRAIIGAGTITLKGLGGSNSVTLTEAQLPAHTHTVTDTGHSHGVTDPGHTHSAAQVGATGTTGAANISAVAGTTGSATTGISINSAQTGIQLGNTGSGSPIDTTPKAMAGNWIIKT